MELTTLHALYVEGLRDLYSAEQQILVALPKMMEAASNQDLVDAFAAHRDQTTEQVARLERIFKDLGVSPKGKTCKGMQGLIAEGAELIKEQPQPDVLDAGLIAAAQHVEHYEIAGYGTVRTYASLLGYGAHVSLLSESLEEESRTDSDLTELAETSVNIAALLFGDEAAEEEGKETSREAVEKKSRKADDELRA